MDYLYNSKLLEEKTQADLIYLYCLSVAIVMLSLLPIFFVIFTLVVISVVEKPWLSVDLLGLYRTSKVVVLQ